MFNKCLKVHDYRDMECKVMTHASLKKYAIFMCPRALFSQARSQLCFQNQDYARDLTALLSGAVLGVFLCF